MYRTFAHALQVRDAAVSMAHALRTGLDATPRVLACPKVTHLSDTHVCWHYREAAAWRVGVTDWRLRDLGPFEESIARRSTHQSQRSASARG